MNLRPAVLLLCACSIGLLTGCGENSTTPATSGGSPASKNASPADPAPQPGVTLTATPNPVPTSGGPGKTTIAWEAGAAGANPDAAVYVVTDGGAEALFAKEPKGSSEAPWIQADHTYEFRLYNNAERQQLLARLNVTATK
ncbi:MAG: hypothetical protein AVDCRST_MAG42-2113 [uncultured Chthoniobacterales bacterium]|uniref:Uncharacterized protein n=1 Tax=uncultured Chthoniobacterales bacterium TaxID=1836801 RepID=A0A6J4I587_9BACT|nr:MAG: hypothetical protein AVDCRST_MAG42-2113 [uncultured Chthoniobacterales bacterium]